MEHTVEADQAASAEGDEQWGEGTEDMATEEEKRARTASDSPFKHAGCSDKHA